MGAVTTPGSCAQRCDARLPAANRRPVGHAVSTPSTYQERASTGQVELRRDSPKGHGTGKGAEAMTGGNVQLRRQRSGELWWRWRRRGPRAPGRGEGCGDGINLKKESSIGGSHREEEKNGGGGFDFGGGDVPPATGFRQEARGARWRLR
jgi:hypothetical protein